MYKENRGQQESPVPAADLLWSHGGGGDGEADRTFSADLEFIILW